MRGSIGVHHLWARPCFSSSKDKLSKKGGKLWTDTYANNTKAQIDYVFFNKKWKNSAVNCEAYSSFVGLSSDHRIVTAKIRLSLRKNVTQKTNPIPYDWDLLNYKDIRDKYVIALRNKFDALQEKTETYSEWWIWKFRQRPPRSNSEIHTNKT